MCHGGRPYEQGADSRPHQRLFCSVVPALLQQEVGLDQENGNPLAGPGTLRTSSCHSCFRRCRRCCQCFAMLLTLLLLHVREGQPVIGGVWGPFIS